MIEAESLVGIDELNNTQAIQSYPNPANDCLTINHQKESGFLMIDDHDGRLSDSFPINLGRNVINISNLNAGIYTCQIKRQIMHCMKNLFNSELTYRDSAFIWSYV